MVRPYPQDNSWYICHIASSSVHWPTVGIYSLQPYDVFDNVLFLLSNYRECMRPCWNKHRRGVERVLITIVRYRRCPSQHVHPKLDTFPSGTIVICPIKSLKITVATIYYVTWSICQLEVYGVSNRTKKSLNNASSDTCPQVTLFLLKSSWQFSFLQELLRRQINSKLPKRLNSRYGAWNLGKSCNYVPVYMLISIIKFRD
jgi:hypothetical protein